MNLRQSIFFGLHSMRGMPILKYYQQFVTQHQSGIPVDTTKNCLINLLDHCQKYIPYYSEVMKSIPGSYQADPFAYLQSFPLLTKKLVRENFASLQSSDLAKRKWYYNTSGGSTGETVRLIQDWHFSARAGALKLLYSYLIGREVGEPEVILWGSIQEITDCKIKLTSRIVNAIMNTTIISVLRLSPEYMRSLIDRINTSQPKLITGYASALYELAKFAQKEKITIKKQNAIISSAYTLHSFMREAIENTFHCKVYDRYGSREVGDIACERPGYSGLWIAPWGNYVEIVDEEGNPVPDGERGEIVVTNLSNYAMPLIRYRLGDIGIMSPAETDGGPFKGRFLKGVLGRSNDDFINQEGVLVDTGYFKLLLYFRDWITQYQIVQKEPDLIVFRFVKDSIKPKQSELDEIAEKSRKIMGARCEVKYEFVDEIQPSPSGKFRFIISEVKQS